MASPCPKIPQIRLIAPVEPHRFDTWKKQVGGEIRSLTETKYVGRYQSAMTLAWFAGASEELRAERGIY
jgi:hypothetical protein